MGPYLKAWGSLLVLEAVNVYENTDEEVLKQVVNTIQSVLSEFIADGLNEGVSGEVGGRSMMQ